MLFFKKLKYREMYAIHAGDLEGGFFVYIKEFDRLNAYALLVMPEASAIYVPHSEIRHDLKYNNIKRVKNLPEEVYEVCKANFKYYAEKAGIYAHR
jgi:hypothetical protein